MSKWDTPEMNARIDAHLAECGLTREQAAANLRRRYPRYTDEKIQEELAIGPLIADLLEHLRNAPPEFWMDAEEAEVETECEFQERINGLSWNGDE